MACKMPQYPSTIKIIEVLSKRLASSYSLIFIVTEYYSRGNLNDFMENNKELNDKQITVIFIEILKVIVFLEENGLNDFSFLKPENILFSENNNNSLAISDFYMPPPAIQLSALERDCKFAAGKILFTLCGNANALKIIKVKK